MPSSFWVRRMAVPRRCRALFMLRRERLCHKGSDECEESAVFVVVELCDVFVTVA